MVEKEGGEVWKKRTTAGARSLLRAGPPHLGLKKTTRGAKEKEDVTRAERGPSLTDERKFMPGKLGRKRVTAMVNLKKIKDKGEGGK